MTNATGNFLSFEAINPILTDSTNELKCLTIGVVPDEEPKLLIDIHEDLLIGHEAFPQRSTIPDPRINHMRSVVQQYSQGAVEISRLRGKIQLSRGPNGLLLAAYSGHRLMEGIVSGVPIRLVSGEPHDVTTSRDIQRTNSLKARLVILDHLLKFAADGWVPTADFVEANDTQDIKPHLTRFHIRRLAAAKLVETKSNPASRAASDARLVRVSDEPRIEKGRIFLSPQQTIRRHLALVDSLSSPDARFISQGLDYMDAIAQNPDLVPLLIARSLASTRHTGKISR